MEAPSIAAFSQFSLLSNHTVIRIFERARRFKKCCDSGLGGVRLYTVRVLYAFSCSAPDA